MNNLAKLFKSICAVLFLVCLVLFFGTAGALEGDMITLGQAAVRTALIFGAMIALIVIGRLDVAAEGE